MTATKKAGRKAGALVGQPHGGKIWSGTPATIVPGPGRPRDEVRVAAIKALAEGPTVLTEIMRGETTVTLREKCPKCGHEDKDAALALPVQVKPGERVRAVEALDKLAGGEDGDRLEDWRVMAECQIAAMLEVVGRDKAEQVLARGRALFHERKGP